MEDSITEIRIQQKAADNEMARALKISHIEKRSEMQKKYTNSNCNCNIVTKFEIFSLLHCAHYKIVKVTQKSKPKLIELIQKEMEVDSQQAVMRLVKNEITRIFLPSENNAVHLIKLLPVSTDSHFQRVEEKSEIDNEDRK